MRNKPLGVTADSVGEILGVAKASVSKFLGV
jgi:predicted transcriptional regulator